MVALFLVAALLIGAGPAACALAPFLGDRSAHADGLAEQAGWSPWRFQTGRFVLRGYGPSHLDLGSHLTVYIEGDGAPWRNRWSPPTDPTPIDPIALRLALADTSQAVYIARPCQYETTAHEDACVSTLWTDGRFSEDVVASVDRAVQAFKAAARAERLTLIGYSGGGVVAALIAARRTDVVKLVTVSAPMHLAAWVSHHDLTPLGKSLDPIDALDALADVPQIHFVGSEDEIVPRQMVEAWVALLPARASATVESVDGVGHDGWADVWPEIVASRLRRDGR